MLKSTLISAIVLATAPLALARNCKGGLKYCGNTLLSIGNYRDQIHQALREAGKPQDENWVRQTLFYCTGIQGGDIRFEASCVNGCQDQGEDHDDTCK